MNATDQMKAMRVREPGGRFHLDAIPRPTLLRPTDVLIDVEASGVVPNLRNVINEALADAEQRKGGFVNVVIVQ